VAVASTGPYANMHHDLQFTSNTFGLAVPDCYLKFNFVIFIWLSAETGTILLFSIMHILQKLAFLQLV